MRLSHNIIANFGGQAVTTLVAFITVPVFLHFLGTEGYGLVSLLLVLQAVTAVLDFGLSTTANREVANYIAQDRRRQDRLDLVRTLEIFYFGTAGVILLAFAALSPLLARRWFTSTHFDTTTVETCLVIAGASIALRWPTSLYQGILRGTEQQVILNIIISVSAVLRGIGAILVLVLISRSVVAFYWSQLVFAVVEVGLSVLAIRRWGDGFDGVGGRFDGRLLRRLWKFSMNVGGLSLFALILKQFDKLAISSLLPLTQLGFYNAASVASNGLTKVSIPVQAAVFPRLTRHHQKSDDPELGRTFHGAVQGITFLTAPLAFILICFPEDILRLWTGNSELAASAAPALALLSAGILFNTMMSVPFSLLLASGLTWVPLVMNGVGALFLAPLTYWLVRTDGITGAAVAWLVFNVINYLIVPPIMFRRVLVGQYRSWLFRDTLPFTVVPLVCFGLARWLTLDGSLPIKGASIVAASLAYAGILFATNAVLRQTLRSLRQSLTRPAVSAGVGSATSTTP
jgi:O-antigen/teichoic acid export membrane protein